jgi:hypothetical protein
MARILVGNLDHYSLGDSRRRQQAMLIFGASIRVFMDIPFASGLARKSKTDI